jgi:SAM-dependent methyltransferase
MQQNVLIDLSAGLCTGSNCACPLCSGVMLKTVSEHEGQRLMKCVQCSARFVLPQPTPAALTAHFEDDRELTDENLEMKFERNREQVLARVAGYIQRLKKRGRILDVGCATGFFLARFFSPRKWEMCGLDLSARPVEKALRKGIRARQGSIHSATFADSSFDVISVIDTFYYFLQPQRELAAFHRVLKPNGMLVLELPLAESRIWRTSHQLGKLLSSARRQLLETSDHLFYYNPKSINLLLERCGFHVTAVLPLPGNRQEHFLRNLIYRAYSALSLVLHFLSGARIMLGPRFLVVAGKIDK